MLKYSWDAETVPLSVVAHEVLKRVNGSSSPVVLYLEHQDWNARGIHSQSGKEALESGFVVGVYGKKVLLKWIMDDLQEASKQLI